MAKHLAKCPKCGNQLTYESAVGDRIQCASCGAVLKAPGKGKPTDPLIGRSFGEFELTALLGRGGMGAVYKGHQASLGRDVAIKVLPEQLARDASYVERFRREARAAAAINHPNIIEVHAIGEAEGHQYIAMELVDGETLAARLKREGRLPPDDAVKMLTQVADALARAHENRILHRDIKPANILITRYGRVKVADFGLAKHEGVDVSVTQTGASLGTPLYMPPEVAEGKPADARSDLYSLGATFYQAIAGKPPFDGSTPAELIVKHVTARVPPLQTVAPDCPATLSRVIHKLLRKNPAERYQSAEELVAALEKVGAQPKVGGASLPGERRAGGAAGHRAPSAKAAGAKHPAPGRKAHRPSPHKKNPLPLVLGGIGVLVLVVVVLLLIPGGGKEKPQAKAPPKEVEKAEPTKEDMTETKKGTPDPTPPRDPREADAQKLFENAQRTAKDGTWLSAETYLARLDRNYAKTEYYTANRAAIDSLRTKIEAALKKPETPKPPGPADQPGPPTDDDPGWTTWESLFDGASFEGWKVGHGKTEEVRIQDGSIYLPNECRVTREGPFPTNDYEFSFEFQRRSGTKGDLASPGFPIGDGTAVIVVGGGLSGRVQAISLSGMKGDLAEGAIRDYRADFPVGEWHRLRVRVTSERVVAWLDGDKRIDVPRAGLEWDTIWGRKSLSFFTLGATGAVRALYLRRLKPEAAALPKPDAEGWISLFDGKTLKGWRIVEADPFQKHGEVVVKDGQLVLGAGEGGTGVVCELPVPRSNYEIVMEAARLTGHGDFAALVFPVGEQTTMLEIRAGIRLRATDDYKYVGPELTFQQGRVYRIHLIVSDSRIRVSLDGSEVIDFPTKGREFSPLRGALLSPLGLSSYQSTGSIHSIRLRRLKPDGTPIVPAKPEEPIAGPWKVYTKWPFDAAEAKRRQEETAKALGVPVEQDIDLGNGVKMTMVLIPAGEFMMGHPERPTPEELVRLYGWKARDYERERPQHRVCVSRPFWLGKTEVTQEQWQAVMGANPSAFASRLNPVERVSWSDCQVFLAKLNATIGGMGVQLPAEAQWEHACRAGAATQFHFGDAKEQLSDHAWWVENAQGRTQPVGRRKPNAWGLHDMAGNVSEWCQEVYRAYAGAARVNLSDLKDARRIMRGGSWASNANDCRSAYRNLFTPARGHERIGFRIAKPLDLRKTPAPRLPPAKPETKAQDIDLGPIDARLAAWDFAGASDALGRVAQPPLRQTQGRPSAMVAQKKDEVARLAKLKAQIIEKINGAKPPWKKSHLLLTGLNGDITKADDAGITAQVGDKTETVAWKDLADRSVGMLLNRCLDRENGDDWLAAGILSIALGELARAEGYFRQATTLGAKVEPYLGPLAEASFKAATTHIDKGDFANAKKALAAFETKYGKTPWASSNKQAIDAARARAEGGIADAAAEKLYTQAAKLYAKKDLWSLKPVIEKLKADFPKATLITDAARKPTFAEMAEAVSKLGNFITVRQDGKGDFKTIQAAIDAAPTNSLIEIQDGGPYVETIVFPQEKPGLALTGRRGVWPLITSAGSRDGVPHVIHVAASGTRIAHVLVSHHNASNDRPVAVLVEGARFTLTSAVVYCVGNHFAVLGGHSSEIRRSVICGCVTLKPKSVVRDSVVLLTALQGLRGAGPVVLENIVSTLAVEANADWLASHCTITGAFQFVRPTAVLRNSIVGQLRYPGSAEHCDVFGTRPYVDGARPGESCFSRDPQFRDPESFDYRLKPTSPCKGKASDGGDIGCRFTPEMLEMLQKALELRKKGIIKF